MKKKEETKERPEELSRKSFSITVWEELARAYIDHRPDKKIRREAKEALI